MKPPALTLRLQQRKLDRFRQVFHHERSYEGNQQQNSCKSSPAQCDRIAEDAGTIHPSERVSDQTGEHQRGHQLAQRPHIHQSGVLIEEWGFEETEEDVFRVYFRDMEPGELDVAELRFRSVRALP